MLSFSHYVIRDTELLQDILDNGDSTTWSDFQPMGRLPIDDQHSNEQLDDNTYDQMLNWSPSDAE